MIDLAIGHIASRLNQHLKRSFDLPEDVVVVSNILDQDGAVATHINNKIVVSLVNLERDTTPYRQSLKSSATAERSPVTSQPLYFNLYLLFAGCFSGNHYPEALKFISNTISFFQREPVLDHQNMPEMDEKIEKLVLDIENLSLQELSNLWGMLSGKYLPSVLYKVRMVAFDAEDIKRRTPALTEPQPAINH